MLDPEYKNAQFEGANLSISLPRNEINIENADDVTDDLGEGDPYDVFLKFFRGEFPKALQKYSTFKNVSMFYLHYGIYYDTNFTSRTFILGKSDLLTFRLPKEGRSVYSDGDTSRFILFIEGFKIVRVSGSTGMWMGGGVGSPGYYTGGSAPKLGHKFRFVVWDNEKGKPAFYGEINSEDDVGFGMTLTDWIQNLNSIANEFVKKSPFKKSK